MPDSIDIAPSSGPLSSEYRQWVFDMAKDIAEFNRMRPFLEMAIRDVAGGGGSVSAKSTFPAQVISEGPLLPGGTTCYYSFTELAGPWDVKDIKKDGRTGEATNTMESNIHWLPHVKEHPIWIPPGIHAQCTLDPDTQDEFVHFHAQAVGFGNPSGEGAIVAMHETIATQEIPSLGSCAPRIGEPFYYFCVPVAVCVTCVAPPIPGS